MMKFMWDPKYSLNIRSIDLQHQKFFEIINNIYYIVSTKRLDKSTLEKTVADLKKYSEEHMAFEEAYFLEFNYPETEEHVAEHNKFRAQIRDFSSKLDKPDIDYQQLANEIAEFSKEWLSAHILDSDHRYCQCFLANGLK